MPRPYHLNTEDVDKFIASVYYWMQMYEIEYVTDEEMAYWEGYLKELAERLQRRAGNIITSGEQWPKL